MAAARARRPRTRRGPCSAATRPAAPAEEGGQRRHRPSPSASRMQQLRPTQRTRQARGGEPRLRARIAARGAGATAPRASARSDDAQLGERLHVERVGVTNDKEVGSALVPQVFERARAIADHRSLAPAAPGDTKLLGPPVARHAEQRSLRSTFPTAGSALNRFSRASIAREGHQPRQSEPTAMPRQRPCQRDVEAPCRARAETVDAPRDCACCPCERPDDAAVPRKRLPQRGAPPAAAAHPRRVLRSSVHRGETRTRCTQGRDRRRRMRPRATAAGAGPRPPPRRSRRMSAPHAPRRECEIQRRAP